MCHLGNSRLMQGEQLVLLGSCLSGCNTIRQNWCESECLLEEGDSWQVQAVS